MYPNTQPLYLFFTVRFWITFLLVHFALMFFGCIVRSTSLRSLFVTQTHQFFSVVFPAAMAFYDGPGADEIFSDPASYRSFPVLSFVVARTSFFKGYL